MEVIVKVFAELARAALTVACVLIALAIYEIMGSD